MPDKIEGQEDQKDAKDKAADPFAEDNPEPDAEVKKDAPETKTKAEPVAVASYKYPVVLQGEAFVYYLEASWTGTDIEGTRERYQGMKESHIFDEAPPADNFIALDLSVRSNFDGIEDKFLSIAKCFMPVMENKMQETLAQAKKDGKEQDFFRTFQTNLKVAVTDSELRTKFEKYKEPEAKAHTEETKTAADTKTKTEHVDILPTYKYPDTLKEEVLSDTLVQGWGNAV